jgi:type III secretion protein HrpB1
MDVLKDPLPCPRAALGAVVDVTAAAFAASDRRAGAVDLDDLEQLVGTLHRLRPGCAEFAFFEGWLQMLREDWDEAVSIFRDLADRSICLPSSQGMLLQCLKAREAFGWQDEARKLAEEHEGDEVGQLARALLASAPLQRAQLDAARTGRFVPPESALALEQDAAPESSAQAAAAPLVFEPSLVMQYLRI